MRYIGAHVSAAGGLENAVTNAKAIGATGFALFTKNQRQWKAPALKPEECQRFKDACAAAGYTAEAILPHDSYLINLGNPDPEKRAKALDAFVCELQRVESLGLKYLNFHPGSGLGAPTDETLRNIAAAIRQALDETEFAVAVIENTAGQGSVSGKSLEELQILCELVGNPERCGVCIDTCHAHAAGIDIVSPEGYDAFWKEFEERLGFSTLKGMHLNDTHSALGSHLDRHACIGDGLLGWELFERLVADSRLDGVPMILETPEPERWSSEIARLIAHTN